MMITRLVAAAVFGAAASSLGIIVSADGQYMVGMLNYPMQWIPLPAVLGAIAAIALTIWLDGRKE